MWDSCVRPWEASGQTLGGLRKALGGLSEALEGLGLGLGGLGKAGAADKGFMLSSQGKASKALPEARKFRRLMDDEGFILVIKVS